MPSDYDKYLESVHSEKSTPIEVVRDVVKGATGKDLKDTRKIIAGEANEVYDVNLEGGNNVILRISTAGYPEFQQEHWAMEECRKVGVPTPEILLIKYLTVADKGHAFCVMEKVDGDTLERGQIDFDKFSLEEKKSFLFQAGEILSKIHSIRTSGWGWMIKDKGQFETSTALFDYWKSKSEVFERAAEEEGWDSSLVGTAQNVVESFRDTYSNMIPCLNHGDYANKHFMVKGGKIVSILDWGGARSDIPVYDFANWDYWFGKDIPTEWLMAGYKNRDLFGPSFDNLLHFIEITRGLELLDWYHQQHYTQRIEKIKTKLIEDLKHF